MALSLAPHGIRVNAIGPGSIMTDMLMAVMQRQGSKRRLLSRTPLGRIGDPAEIAAIAAFLASRRGELHHRPDDLRRRRPSAAELYGAGEGGVARPFSRGSGGRQGLTGS